jgi:hypothetical protein
MKQQNPDDEVMAAYLVMELVAGGDCSIELWITNNIPKSMPEGSCADCSQPSTACIINAATSTLSVLDRIVLSLDLHWKPCI